MFLSLFQFSDFSHFCKSLIPTVLTHAPITPFVEPICSGHADRRATLPCIAFALICRSSSFSSLLLCSLSGGPMLRGFLWRSPGTAYAVPPGMHSSAALIVWPRRLCRPSSLFFSFSLLSSLLVPLPYSLLYHVCHSPPCVTASAL